MTRTAMILFTALWLGTAGQAVAAPLCSPRAEDQPALTNLRQVMATGRFATYEPTSLKIINFRPTQADPASISADLIALRSKFDGLITYSALNGAERVPDTAANLFYRAVIVGIWDVTNQQEIDNAVAAWMRHPALVVGISVGNEAVFGKRATSAQVMAAIAEVQKRAPGVAVTTTEPFHMFTQPMGFDLTKLDFMLTNIHPVFQPWFKGAPTANAADFVANVVGDLAKLSCGPVLVKETGEPTGPASMGYTPERQAEFYRLLRDRLPPTQDHAISYFSAFDAPWRVNDVDPVLNPVAGAHPEEGAWGLYTEDRQPKSAAKALPPLPVPR